MVYDCCQNPETRPRMSNSNGVLQTLTTGCSSLWSTSKKRLIRAVLTPVLVWLFEAAPCNIFPATCLLLASFKLYFCSYVVSCDQSTETGWSCSTPMVFQLTEKLLCGWGWKQWRLANSAIQQCASYLMPWAGGCGCWDKHSSRYLAYPKILQTMRFLLSAWNLKSGLTLLVPFRSVLGQKKPIINAKQI